MKYENARKDERNSLGFVNGELLGDDCPTDSLAEEEVMARYIIRHSTFQEVSYDTNLYLSHDLAKTYLFSKVFYSLIFQTSNQNNITMSNFSQSSRGLIDFDQKSLAGNIDPPSSYA